MNQEKRKAGNFLHFFSCFPAFLIHSFSKSRNDKRFFAALRKTVGFEKRASAPTANVVGMRIIGLVLFVFARRPDFRIRRIDDINPVGTAPRVKPSIPNVA